MKKYIVKNKANGSVIGTFDSKAESFKCIMQATEEGISELILDVKDIKDYPLTFEDACKVLEINSCIAFNGGVGLLVRAAVAFYKLCIIAEAWNKIDGFLPDFSNTNQYKYYPWFSYDRHAARFVCTGTSNTILDAAANIGFRLCFKTEETAKKFGETFTELYNEIFI